MTSTCVSMGYAGGHAVAATCVDNPDDTVCVSTLVRHNGQVRSTPFHQHKLLRSQWCFEVQHGFRGFKWAHRYSSEKEGLLLPDIPEKRSYVSGIDFRDFSTHQLILMSPTTQKYYQYPHCNNGLTGQLPLLKNSFNGKYKGNASVIHSTRGPFLAK